MMNEILISEFRVKKILVQKRQQKSSVSDLAW